MRKLLFLFLLLPFIAPAQSGQHWARYFFTGSMKIGGGLQGYGNATLLAQDSNAYAESPSSILEIVSPTYKKGIIIPLVKNKDSIASPVAGLMAFDTLCKCFYAYTGLTWKRLDSVSAGGGTDSAVYLTVYDASQQYQPIGSYVPQSRTLTINGVTFDLSANRTWTVSSVDSTVAGYGLIETANSLRVDTSLIASQYDISQFISASDTAGMLSAYATAIGQRVKYTDTSGMLANYGTAINQRVKYTDTGAMLANYLSTLNLKENTANKKTTVTASNTDFPSGQAVINYVTGQGYTTAQSYDGVLGVGNTTNKQAIHDFTGAGIFWYGSRSGVRNVTLGNAGAISAEGYLTVGSATDSTIVGVQGVTRKNTPINLWPLASGSRFATESQIPTTLPPTDGDKGDITVSGTGAIWTIDNSVVTSSKMASQTSSQVDGWVSDNTGTGLLMFNSSPTVLSPTFTGEASPTYSQGKLTYDTDNESLTFYNNDNAVSLQIGQEEWIKVRNVSGSSIPNGTPVYITGANTGLPTIAPAASNAAATTVCVGLATETIANGSNGYVTCIGLVRGLNTSGFTAGQTVYVGTSAGTLTATAPVSPNYRMRVGMVGTSNASTGTIHVTPSTAALGNGTQDQVSSISTTGTQEYHSAGGKQILGVPTSTTFNGLATGSTTLFTTATGRGQFIITNITIVPIAVTGTPAGTMTGTIIAAGNTQASVSVLAANATPINRQNRQTLTAGAISTAPGTNVQVTIAAAHTGATVLTYRVDIVGYYEL